MSQVQVRSPLAESCRSPYEGLEDQTYRRSRLRRPVREAIPTAASCVTRLRKAGNARITGLRRHRHLAGACGHDDRRYSIVLLWVGAVVMNLDQFTAATSDHIRDCGFMGTSRIDRAPFGEAWTIDRLRIARSIRQLV